MVDSALIIQLQSMNATQRKNAVMALARLKDRSAIPHLTRTAENDTEDELRELARKAIAYIERHAPPETVKPFMDMEEDEEEESAAAEVYQSPVAPPIFADEEEDEDEAKQKARERENREWGERYIDSAWQAHYTGDDHSAESYLRKAFERAPQLANSDNAREAASKILNMNPDRAVATLTKPKTESARPATIGRRLSAITSSVPDNRSIDEIEDGSMKTLLLDLGMFFAITLVVNLLMTLFGTQLLQSLAGYLDPNDPEYAASYAILMGIAQYDAGQLIVYALGNSLLALVQTLIMWVAIHIIATTIVGGNSTFPRLVRKTHLLFALYSPLMLVVMVMAFLLTSVLQEIALLPTILVLGIVGSTFALAWQIGSAYRFDVARGCLTMILTTVAFVCCSISIAVTLMSSNVDMTAFMELSLTLTP